MTGASAAAGAHAAVQADAAQQASLADLLKIILDIDRRTPVRMTAGFSSWLGAGPSAPLADAPATSRGGVWLIDTRDSAARSGPLLRQALSGSADAALVLASWGPPPSRLRAAVRGLRGRGGPRLPATEVRAQIEESGGSPYVLEMAFDGWRGVPTGFRLTDVARGAPTGIAFLLTPGEPFQGPLWTFVGGRLAKGRSSVREAQAAPSSKLQVIDVQLRDRGAAVVLVRTGEGTFVVRVVPAGPLQAVVQRNHTVLGQLRGALDSHGLLRLMPEPVMADVFAGHAVLAETFLPGTLAWMVARGPLGPSIHENALHYLDVLRAETEQRLDGPDGPVALVAEDLERLGRADFVSAAVRDRIDQELRRTVEAFAGRTLCTCASHGDFGPGNILVDPQSGVLTGVIDWDTARVVDLPGIDRVNLEIQTLRSVSRLSFRRAVERAWKRGPVRDELLRAGGSVTGARALFGAAVCRYITRAFTYPALYADMADQYERALRWLARQ